MTTQRDCTCEPASCNNCGPSGTGCSCTRGKCECRPCLNAPHVNQCGCRGTGENCVCTAQGQVCTCSATTE